MSSADEEHLRTAMQEATVGHHLAPGAAGRALRAVSRRRRAGAVACAVGALGAAGGLALTGAGRSGGSSPSSVSVAASASTPRPEPAGSPATSPAPTVTPAPGNPGNPGAPVPALPALGAASYPLALYPAPVAVAPGTGNGSIRQCPNLEGLQTPTAASVNAAVADERRIGTISLADDLAHTDRAWWPNLVPWQRNPIGPDAVPVLHAAALQTPIEGFGVPDPAQGIGRSCGVRTEQLSILVISGPANGPALQEALVFIQRRGRVLLYFTYP